MTPGVGSRVEVGGSAEAHGCVIARPHNVTEGFLDVTGGYNEPLEGLSTNRFHSRVEKVIALLSTDASCVALQQGKGDKNISVQKIVHRI